MYLNCSLCFSLFRLMDAWLLFLLLVKHWPHLYAQPTPIKVHILQYVNEVFTFTAATGIFLFNVNQHFQGKPWTDTSSSRSIVTPVATSVVLVFFWQNSHPIQGNEKSFSICIILHYFLAHLHWCLVTTLALLNMLNSGGREHELLANNRPATDASAIVVNQGKCK